MGRTEHRRQEAGAGAEVEHTGASRRPPLRYELQGGAVELGEAGDETTTGRVVVTGGGIERGNDRHELLSRSRTPGQKADGDASVEPLLGQLVARTGAFGVPCRRGSVVPSTGASPRGAGRSRYSNWPRPSGAVPAAQR